MKKLNTLLPAFFTVVLLAFFCMLPALTFAQNSSEIPNEIQNKNIEQQSQGAGVVIFSVNAGSWSRHLDTLLVLDLPQGASLQYNGDGIYQINNMPDVYGHYSIKLRAGGNLLNGVTTADISLIQRHILGNGNLADEYKLLAADVNCDGKISAKDLVEIRRAILDKINKFGCDTNYGFVPGTLEFEWTGNTINLGDFIAFKMGDVNGSAAYNSESASGNIGN